MSDNKNQKSGDDCINLQANEININNGLSFTDVKNVALEIFNNNFQRLSSIAAETAAKRAEEITDKFIKELQLRNPNGAAAAEDPDFQYTLFNAQKEYARSGDKELADILIDILVERTKSSDRNILNIVLNESLSIAPKITSDQLATLTAIFTVKHVTYTLVHNLEDLHQLLSNNLFPLADKLPTKQLALQHLEYTGCCSIGMSGHSMVYMLKYNYSTLFCKGIPKIKIDQLQDETIKRLIIPHHKNAELFIPNEINSHKIKEAGAQLGIPTITVEKLIKITEAHSMNDAEIWTDLESADPKAKTLKDKWAALHLDRISLTSVGIAIGHANQKRLFGRLSPLNAWIL